MNKEQYIASKLREFPNVKHIDYSICSRCKNCCCKITACGLLPHDIPELTVDGIKRILDTGKYSITFMYIASINKPLPIMISREIGGDKINNSLIRTTCSLLGENGCTLSEAERPTQALLLIPRENEKCETLVPGWETMREWQEYEELMKTVIFEETGKSVNELFEEGCRKDVKKLIQKIENDEELTYTEDIAMDLLTQKAMHMIVSNASFEEMLLEIVLSEMKK